LENLGLKREPSHRAVGGGDAEFEIEITTFLKRFIDRVTDMCLVRREYAFDQVRPRLLDVIPDQTPGDEIPVPAGHPCGRKGDLEPGFFIPKCLFSLVVRCDVHGDGAHTDWLAAAIENCRLVRLHPDKSAIFRDPSEFAAAGSCLKDLGNFTSNPITIRDREFGAVRHVAGRHVEEEGWELLQEQQLDAPLAAELIFKAYRVDFIRPSREQILRDIGMTPDDVSQLLEDVDRRQDPE